ncbi:MAG: aldo/keto reductase [Deltaproteobacteria bacterium]|nr:MAG: aldo/keto reductase [Deltaproteobacteria bacterium]
MRTIRLGRTDVQVPVVSLGTWAYGGENTSASGQSIGWSGHDAEEARAALRAAHAHGITHWDTADVYGDGRSEQLLGELWGDVPRDDVFLASKVGWDAGGHAHYYHPDLVRERVERSLRNLKTDVIDLYYLHHCDFGPRDVYLDDALEVLVRAKEAGKIRFIGLSDWSCHNVMRVIARVDPDVVQPLRNLTADSWVESGLQAWCAEHDVGVAFFSPIRHGLLLGKYDGPTHFPDGDFRKTDGAFLDADLIARLRDNARALRDGLSHLAEPVLSGLIAPLLADAPTACVLLGQRTPRHVESAARADALLSRYEVRWVRSLFAGLAR